MPSAINTVIAALAAVRGTSPGEIEAIVEQNFALLVGDDPGLRAVARLLPHP